VHGRLGLRARWRRRPLHERAVVPLRRGGDQRARGGALRRGASGPSGAHPAPARIVQLPILRSSTVCRGQLPHVRRRQWQSCRVSRRRVRLRANLVCRRVAGATLER
jgi:hypothetical protein